MIYLIKSNNKQAMKIKIEVSKALADLPQEQSQKVKRVANVLREAGFEVDIVWKEDKK